MLDRLARVQSLPCCLGRFATLWRRLLDTLANIRHLKLTVHNDFSELVFLRVGVSVGFGGLAEAPSLAGGPSG